MNTVDTDSGMRDAWRVGAPAWRGAGDTAPATCHRGLSGRRWIWMPKRETQKR